MCFLFSLEGGHLTLILDLSSLYIFGISVLAPRSLVRVRILFSIIEALLSRAFEARANACCVCYGL